MHEWLHHFERRSSVIDCRTVNDNTVMEMVQPTRKHKVNHVLLFMGVTSLVEIQLDAGGLLAAIGQGTGVGIADESGQGLVQFAR